VINCIFVLLSYLWLFVLIGSVAGLQNRIECYTVSQKTSYLWFAITLTYVNGFWYFFGRNVTNKVSNQKTLYCATTSNLCFCTTWQNSETQKSHFHSNAVLVHCQNSTSRCLISSIFFDSWLILTWLYDSLNLVITAFSSGLLGAWFRRKQVDSAAELDCVACIMHVHQRVVFLKEKMSSVMCLIASNIYWDSKISHWYCPLTFTAGLTKNHSHLLRSNWHRYRLSKHRACV